MANKKISELDQTLNLSDQADFPLSQDNGGEPTTFRAKLTQIATKIAEAITFSNLKTGNKQLVSAVNQTISNLADDFNTTAGSTYSKDDCVLYNGVLYQCINNSGTTSGTFIDADWTAIKAVDVGSGGGGGGGAGGHTIVDDAGTSLTQRTKLQFNGAYSKDNDTDDTTEVNVVREMTKAEFDLLSADEKTGFINITDDISGGLKYVKETLYSNVDESSWSAQSSGDTLTLTDNILDYDEVYFESAFWETNNSTGKKLTHFVTSMIDHATIQIAYEKYGSATYDGMFDVCPVLLSSGTLYTFAISMQVPTITSLKIQSKYVGGWNANSWGITRIVGIKYLSDSEHTYSEDEQIVGTWIDGSTLYEKTISTNSSSVDLTSLSISTLAKIEGIIQHTNGKVTPISYGSSTYDWATPIYDIASKTLSLVVVGTSQGGTWVLTIRYTKTSA